jgi:hypothetical protein
MGMSVSGFMLIDLCTSDLTILFRIIMCGATAVVIYGPNWMSLG